MFAYTDVTETKTVDTLMPDFYYMIGEEALTQSLAFLTYRVIPDDCLPNTLDSFIIDFTSAASNPSLSTSQSDRDFTV